MEDEYQSTLKKKISILFQLGKWPDVVKLCDSYTEKYGKDMEMDMLRYKSERHLGISAPPAPAAPPAPPAEKAAAPVEEQPLAQSPEAAADDLAIPLHRGEETAALRQDKIAYDPSADEGELIITDPFAENEPGFSLAPDEPPVTLGDHGENENLQIASQPEEEMAAAQENQAELPREEMEIDFRTMGSMTIDADPQLTPDAPKEEPAAAVVRPREEAIWEELGRADGLKELAEEIPTPAYKPAADEKKHPGGDTFEEFLEKGPAAGKRAFTRKLALLILLPLAAAVALWLVLSGKLNFSGGEAPTINPAPVARPAVRKRPPAARKLPPAAPAANTVEMDKAFDEKFQRANELYKKGEILKAWAVVLEAKKIKMTEPLRLLEEQLALKIRADEAQARQESQVVQSQWELESQAFAKAEAVNTLAAWQNFLNAYPQGEFANRAEKKVAGFEKKIQENSDQQLQLKILQSQKVKLRSSYLSLGQADITAILSQGGKAPSQLEAHEHGGARVMLDYAAGLMWSMWNKPMDYSKAKWWANRVTAGYGGWRLPTAEEALSLLRMDRAQYSGLAGFAVWTGDTVSDQPRSVWVLRLPEGQFAIAGYEQMYYVWAVRKAGK
jgi:hypothetical protein